MLGPFFMCEVKAEEVIVEPIPGWVVSEIVLSGFSVQSLFKNVIVDSSGKDEMCGGLGAASSRHTAFFPILFQRYVRLVLPAVGFGEIAYDVV